MCAEDFSRYRLRVVADADPGAFVRVLERFQTLSLLPRRIHIELGSNDLFHIEIDVFGVNAAQRKNVALKVSQAVCVLSVYWQLI